MLSNSGRFLQIYLMTFQGPDRRNWLNNAGSNFIKPRIVLGQHGVIFV